MKLTKEQRDALSKAFSTISAAFSMSHDIEENKKKRAQYKRFSEISFDISVAALNQEKGILDIAEMMSDFANNLKDESTI